MKGYKGITSSAQGWLGDGGRGESLDASFVLVTLEVASFHERGRVQETVDWLGY